MTDQLSPNETLAAMAAARRRGWNRDKMTLACWIAQKVQPQSVSETAGTRTLPGADAMSSQADRPLRQASVPTVLREQDRYDRLVAVDTAADAREAVPPVESGPDPDVETLIAAGWQRHKANSWISPEYGGFYCTRDAVAKVRASAPAQTGTPRDAHQVEKIHAPFTPDQVEALNRWQDREDVHPFTCGRSHGGHGVILRATERCWVCPAGNCGYEQYWAHAFMALLPSAPERSEP